MKKLLKQSFIVSLPIHWSIYEYSPKSLDISHLICYHTIQYRNSKSKLGFLFKVINTRQPCARGNRLPGGAPREALSSSLTPLRPTLLPSVASVGHTLAPALTKAWSALKPWMYVSERGDGDGMGLPSVWPEKDGGGSTHRRLEVFPEFCSEDVLIISQTEVANWYLQLTTQSRKFL